MLGGNLDIQVEVLRRFDEYLRVRMSGDQAVEINTARRSDSGNAQAFADRAVQSKNAPRISIAAAISPGQQAR
jgi:hypothetical protein